MPVRVVPVGVGGAIVPVDTYPTVLAQVAYDLPLARQGAVLVAPLPVQASRHSHSHLRGADNIYVQYFYSKRRTKRVKKGVTEGQRGTGKSKEK